MPKAIKNLKIIRFEVKNVIIPACADICFLHSSVLNLTYSFLTGKLITVFTHTRFHFLRRLWQEIITFSHKKKTNLAHKPSNWSLGNILTSLSLRYKCLLSVDLCYINTYKTVWKLFSNKNTVNFNIRKTGSRDENNMHLKHILQEMYILYLKLYKSLV